MKLIKKVIGAALPLLLSTSAALAVVPPSSQYANMAYMYTVLEEGGNDVDGTANVTFGIANESSGLPGTGIITAGAINFQFGFPNEWGLEGPVGEDATPSPELVSLLAAQGWSIDYLETGPAGTITVTNTVDMAEGDYLPLTLPIVGFALGEGTGGGTVDRNSPVVVGDQTIVDNVLDITLNVISLPVPLSVDLMKFTAIQQGNTSLLEWVTASEQNNKGFEVERSLDSRNWTKIGFVSSQSENGSSITKLDYNIIDHNPATGKNYYRLKQVDLDGKYEYSAVRVVNFNNDAAIRIYPNPAKDDIYVEGLSGEEVISIYDNLGRLIIEQKSQDTKVQMSIKDFVAGIYSLQISENGKLVSATKVVKQ